MEWTSKHWVQWTLLPQHGQSKKQMDQRGKIKFFTNIQLGLGLCKESAKCAGEGNPIKEI